MPHNKLQSKREEVMKRFDEKYHSENGYELLLKSPHHFQLYDVTPGIKSFLSFSIDEIIEGVCEIVEEMKKDNERETADYYIGARAFATDIINSLKNKPQ